MTNADQAAIAKATLRNTGLSGKVGMTLERGSTEGRRRQTPTAARTFVANGMRASTR
jgi:hypothetical protein